MSEELILAALARIEAGLSRQGTEQGGAWQEIDGKLDAILDQLSAMRLSHRGFMGELDEMRRR